MNRYDDEARLIFHYAREEANNLGQNQVGPEHLLLGLMRGKGGGREVLEAAGATLDALRAHIRLTGPEGHPPYTFNDAPSITPKSRRVMEVASHEARKLGAQVTSSQHILLALLDSEQRAVRGALESVSPDLRLLRQQAESAPATPPELADAQDAAGRRVQQQAMAELLDHLEGRSFVPASGESRAELLSLLLSGAAHELLPRLETMVDRWLSGPDTSVIERRGIVRVLVGMALNRPR